MEEANSKTTLHHRRDGFSDDCGYFPAIDVDVSIDSTDATVYTMMDYFKRFLISAGYYEESFIDACYKITEEHELAKIEKQEQDKKQKTRSHNRYRMGETGIDSENFCFKVRKETDCDI